MDCGAKNCKDYWEIARSHCKLDASGTFHIHINQIQAYIQDERMDVLQPHRVPVMLVSNALCALLWSQPVVLTIDPLPANVNPLEEFEVLPHLWFDAWREAADAAITRRGEEVASSRLHDILLPRLAYLNAKDCVDAEDHSILHKKVVDAVGEGRFKPEIGSMLELAVVLTYIILGGKSIRTTNGTVIRRSDMQSFVTSNMTSTISARNPKRVTTNGEYWEKTSLQALCIRWFLFALLITLAVLCGIYTDGNIVDKLLRPLEFISYIGLLGLVGAHIEPANIRRFRSAMLGAKKLVLITSTEVGVSYLQLLQFIGRMDVGTPENASFAGKPESKSRLRDSATIGSLFRAGYTIHSTSIVCSSKRVWLLSRKSGENTPYLFSPDVALTPHHPNVGRDFVYEVPNSTEIVG